MDPQWRHTWGRLAEARTPLPRRASQRTAWRDSQEDAKTQSLERQLESPANLWFTRGNRSGLEIAFSLDDVQSPHPVSSEDANRTMIMKYGLLWFLGVPIPVLIVIYLMFHH